METGMLKIWNATNFRRTLGGLCLIVAPLVQFAAEKISPRGAQSASGVLQSAIQQNDRFLQGDYLNILSGILFIPAFFAILHVVRRHGVILAHIGVSLALVGVVLFVFVNGGANLMVGVMGSPGLDSGAMSALIQKSIGGTSPVTVTWLGLYMEGLGIFLIGLAVWRSGFGFRWAGPLISIWILADFFNPFQSLVADYVVAALGVIGLGAIGYRILMMRDSEWESAAAPADRPATGAVPLAEPAAGS
jgi:hypothetical protein